MPLRAQILTGLKWNTIARDTKTLGYAASRVIQETPDSISPNCSVFPVTAYLADHRADTLAGVLKVAEEFAATHNIDVPMKPPVRD